MKLKRFATGLTLATTLIVALGFSFQPTMAAESITGCKDADYKNCLDSPSQKPAGERSHDPLGIPVISLSNIAKTAVGVLSTVAGALSVIYLVIGGIKYSSSNGDSGKIQSAKNTITYAIIGLVVSITAGAIVGFVIASSPSG
ncbi:hypothetical protein EPO04_03230 [Patescibacteria group bacterium]|nr:MAG: hypothetical protein EPO04_03230 [Patescibacteria group bacterium]